MQCSSCRTQIPEGATHCPVCATLTPYGVSQSQIMPDEPTAVSSPSPPPPPAIPATAYGSDPYGGASQNPYEPPSPYAEPQQPYAPMPKKNTLLRVLIGVIVLLIIVGGVLGIRLYTTTTSPTTHATTSPMTHYPFSTNLVLNDPLSNISNAATYGWSITNGNIGTCAFTDGAYEVTTRQNYILYCPARNTNFSNFTYEVQMTIKTGGAGARGGVIFRHELGAGKNYMFLLGADGSYYLDVTRSTNSRSILSSGTVSDFATGFNQPHTIGIVANESQISAYVDQHLIAQVYDTTYTSGVIGVLSRYGSRDTTVAYTNAKVWQLR
ncbi:MAG: hypothetical protein JOZ18_00715 [Chloroflexi bacterium]|nr:hypothetical protein [Chloroflexota bacterium]